MNFDRIYAEARRRFLEDATCPVDITEIVARVAYEEGLAAQGIDARSGETHSGSMPQARKPDPKDAPR